MKKVLLSGLLFLSLVGFSAHTFADSFADGLTAYQSKDYEKARKIFKLLAEQGEVMAQRYLGEMYDKGKGGTKDYQQAIYWYQQAAAKKDSKSQFHLGLKYANGHGVPVDNKQAYAWFAIAFNNGYKPAADSIKVMNKTMSSEDRQEALRLAEKMLQTLH